MDAKTIVDMRTAALAEIAKADKDGQDYGVRLHTFYMVAEIAVQLAQLNEGLELLTSVNHFRVQVEPGQYPIVVDGRK